MSKTFSSIAPKFLSDNSAVSFVEIMIAGFLMLALFVIGWSISESFSGTKHVRNYETAIFLANQTIEAVRAARTRELGYEGDGRRDTLLADFRSDKNLFDENGEGFVPTIKIGDTTYERKIFIEQVPSKNPNLLSGLRQIRVLISWHSEGTARTTDFEVVTLHSDQW